MWTFIVVLLLLYAIYLVFTFCSAFGETGSVVGAILSILILLGAGHAWLCSNIWWYGKKVVPPEISVNFKDGFLTETTIEPLLGEGIVQDEDGNYSITLIDHKIHVDDYDKTPDLVVSISPENATLKKADTTLKITQLAMEDAPSWLTSSGKKDQVTTLDDNFNYTISGSNVGYNEGSRTEPTKYRIVAKNKRGEATATLSIKRYALDTACKRYEADHPGRSAVSDISLCKERADYNEAHKPSSSSNGTSNSNNSGSNNSNSGSNKPSSSGPSGPVCIHYEYGRCWDDLELEAYSKGQYDKLYGYYGDSYYDGGDDCDDLCQSILEYAYDEGYGDY